jgi:hypothetical protein
MARKVVRVPEPKPGPVNKNRPLSPALKERVDYYRGVESTLPLGQQTGIDFNSIKTEGDVDAYVQAVTKRFLQPASKWVPVVGAGFGFLTFIFFASLVVASVNGKSVPPESRILVVAVLAIGIALSASFLGGTASASGKLPLPWSMHPVTFSIVGGSAVFVIVFLIGYASYVRAGEDTVILAGTVLDADSALGIPGATIIIKTDVNIYEREATDTGDFRVSDIPHLFNKQITVSAKADNYKLTTGQTVLITSYVQPLKLQMHNCYNGLWHDVHIPVGTKGLQWRFKVEGTTLHIYRMDGLVSGDFHHGPDDNWTGNLSWSNGDKKAGLTLHAPNADCNQIITNLSWSYARDTSE